MQELYFDTIRLFMKEYCNVFKEIIKIQEEGTSAALCILTHVEGSSPQISGAKMIVNPDGQVVGTVGGGALEKYLIEASLEVIRSGKIQNIDLNLSENLGMNCGGKVQAYIEPIKGPPQLVIFGAGHIAQATCEVAKILGFQVTVIDDRPETCNQERFSKADRLVVSDFSLFASQYPDSTNTYFLLLTRGHQWDQKILEILCKKTFAWIGMIGSKRKAHLAMDQLRKKDVPEEILSKIEAPVGLNIGAVSPEEIAISICARWVEFYRKPNPHSSPQNRNSPLTKSSPHIRKKSSN